MSVRWATQFEIHGWAGSAARPDESAESGQPERRQHSRPAVAQLDSTGAGGASSAVGMVALARGISPFGGMWKSSL